jgi:hypothetical protein
VNNSIDICLDQGVTTQVEFDDEADRIQRRLDRIAGTLDWLQEELDRIAGTLPLLAVNRG